METIKRWLSKLSFRTGVIVLAMCVPCYLISFFPVIPWIKDLSIITWMSAYGKWLWWVVWFGLAKTFQYSGITILGVEGYKRLKAILSPKKRKFSTDYINPTKEKKS